jgi:hypothetical protein
VADVPSGLSLTPPKEANYSYMSISSQIQFKAVWVPQNSLVYSDIFISNLSELLRENKCRDKPTEEHDKPTFL